jgi:glycosyltransferase involved in cell wall biosynthesis
MSIKIGHVIHGLKVGGVENAVRYHLINGGDGYRVYCLDLCDEDFIPIEHREKVFFRKNGESKVVYYLKLIVRVYKDKPDVLVSSLWRSHLFAMFISLISSFKWVSFFHSAHVFHFCDKFTTYLAVKLSDDCFVDSNTTSNLIKSIDSNVIPKIISFSFSKHKTKLIDWKEKDKAMVYLGRLEPIKNILYLIDCYFNAGVDISFHIYGAGSQFGVIQQKILHLGLSKKVILKGEISPDHVNTILTKYRYYAQSSLNEGMAMSVHQAMKMGCCCIVTFVGEISNYAEHMFNAYELPQLDAISGGALIKQAVSDDEQSYNLALSAIKSIEGCEDFSISFNAACLDFVSI